MCSTHDPMLTHVLAWQFGVRQTDYPSTCEHGAVSLTPDVPCHRQAKVVFHSVNGGPGRVDVILPFHDSNVQYRAMASKLFIATAQAAQPDGQNAHSGLVAPNGTWVAQVELGKTGVYIGEVEL